MEQWFANHTERYTVLVAESNEKILGWVALNPYSHRCAYAGVGELSVYIDRFSRGKGVGTALLQAIEAHAKVHGFYKIVLFTFPFNSLGQGLYKKQGFREVGVFQNQGKLDGKFVDIAAMEKLIK